MATARRWNEGGGVVTFHKDDDDFVTGFATLGRHPNVFVFDPRPLWRLLRGGRWDILEVHEEPCSLATAEVLLLRLLLNQHTPFLLYSAQNISKRYPPPFRWIERYALRNAAGAFVCNAEAGEILRSKGLRGELRVIPLGVDLERFGPADRSPPNGRLRVGYVGRLDHHKGVHVLLDAVEPDAQIEVEVVGSGPEASSLAAQAARLSLGERCRFTGFAEYSDLPARYRRFDVLAVPSLPTPRWTEQFGRVAVEAMATGVPVVASDAGALAEVVGDGGLVFEPGNAGALRAALQRIRDEPGLWAQLRAAGLARAERFSWATVAADHLELHEAVTRRGRAA